MHRTSFAPLLFGLWFGCTEGASPTEAPPVAEPVAPGPPTAEGVVLEVIPVPDYVYLRLSMADGERWAAVPEATIQVGARVTLVDPVEMTNLHSPALDRDFPKILFASLGPAPGEHGSAGP